MELTPGAATGMTVGLQITQTEPPLVVTTGMRTEVPGGVDFTRPPAGRCYGVWRYRRWRFGM